MIGHGIPSPETARQFLYQFHEKEKIEAAKQGREPKRIAYIPEETEGLAGLGRVNRDQTRQSSVRYCGGVTACRWADCSPDFDWLDLFVPGPFVLGIDTN